LAQYKTKGVVNNLYCAFSRAQQQKVYVQDVIMRNKEEMMKLLFESNAVFYMCG